MHHCLLAHLCGHGGDLYSRMEESSVQQLYSITLLVHKCCPLQVRGGGGGGAWLDVGGKVECVALEFSDGDGRMLEVIQQHLDLEQRQCVVDNQRIRLLSEASLLLRKKQSRASDRNNNTKN